MTPARILFVDDNEAWLSIITGILRHDPRWQLVGDAHDGIEAIQKAQQLQPDVIVLDLELPQTYGFEAARRLSSIAPGCKILFLSTLASSEAAAVAFMMGAVGYILKSEAAVELVPALETILEGKTFVSKALSPDSAQGPQPQ